MRPFLAGLVAGTLVLTALPAVDYALEARENGRTTLALRVGVNLAGPDTLVASVGWRLGSDGKGPVDSLKVNVTALAGGWLTVRLPANAVSAEVRQGIPPLDGTYTVQAQVCSYRRAKASCAAPAQVNLVVMDTPPPTPEGVTLTTTTVITP